jgi:hypothetical protein
VLPHGGRAFYVVTYLWQLLMFFFFMGAFLASGYAAGLSTFTKNSISLQVGHSFSCEFLSLVCSDRQTAQIIVSILCRVACEQLLFYFLWGHVLCAWSFWVASIWAEARQAVLLCMAWIIVSGFTAFFVLTELVQSGNAVLVQLLELVPSFALYQGMDVRVSPRCRPHLRSCCSADITCSV